MSTHSASSLLLIAPALAPLRAPLFRALWIATVASNAGTWMQDVGAAWLMTTLDPSAFMVALVRTASSLPMFLLALPAGALADVVDRRRLLLFSQFWMLLAATALTLSTIAGLTTPWVLLGLTFALAIGTALHAPAWQATLLELVPRTQLHAAIALNSVSLNLARSVGPALGGLAIAAAGPAATFLLNALSFGGVIYVLFRWKRPPAANIVQAERIAGAIRTGLRYVRHTPAVRVALVRELAFVVYAAAFWALLPSFARFDLARGPAGYGVLIGFFGAGAVLAAALQPRWRQRLPLNRLVSIAIVTFSVTLAAIAWTRHFVISQMLMIVAGGAWLSLLSAFNAALQSLLPAWVRGRVLAVSILMFFAGMTLGSAVWGYLATHIGVPYTFTVAALGAVLTLVATYRYRLVSGEHLDLRPSVHWPAPEVVEAPEPEQGPVVVTIDYWVTPERQAGFEATMRQVRRLRRRDGAVSWGLLRNIADPGRFTETFVVESWIEHLRQHERVTVADREILDRTKEFHTGPTPPRVTHYLVESLLDR